MPEPTPHRTNRTDTTNRSHASHASYPEGFMPPHGGYEDLLSFQKARIIFDATVRFCDRFIDKRSRTHDQMVQAARSGNKNILEGSQASPAPPRKPKSNSPTWPAPAWRNCSTTTATSCASAAMLLGQELQGSALRAQARRKSRICPTSPIGTYIETRPAEIVANILICLIHQANYLLDQQLRRLEQDFLKEGGLRERMTRARLTTRAHRQR